MAGKRISYSEDQRKTMLLELAKRNGRVKETAEIVGVTENSLIDWKKRYPDYYARVANDVANQNEQRIIQDIREKLDAAGEVEATVLAKLATALDDENLKLKPTDLANILQRVTIVKGINADKLLKLTGRPTGAPLTNVDDLLSRLARRGVITVDVIPEEIPPPKELNGRSV